MILEKGQQLFGLDDLVSRATSPTLAAGATRGSIVRPAENGNPRLWAGGGMRFGGGAPEPSKLSTSKAIHWTSMDQSMLGLQPYPQQVVRPPATHPNHLLRSQKGDLFFGVQSMLDPIGSLSDRVRCMTH